MTMLLATHEMGFAREVATKVCFLDERRGPRGGPARADLQRPARRPRPRASCAGSSRPGGSNFLAGLRELRPARLAALGNRFLAHPAAHCAATQLRPPQASASSARCARQSVLGTPGGALRRHTASCRSRPIPHSRGGLGFNAGHDPSTPAHHFVTDLLPAQVPTACTYVLDTSVLLADPASVFRFDEHEVVLPLVVLTELEAKRDHPELGWAARQEPAAARGSPRAVRLARATDADHTARRHAARRDQPQGRDRAAGRAHRSRTTITASSRSRRTWPTRATDVVVVTKDLPLRLKASIVGLDADEYRNELAGDTSWTGFVELEVESESIDQLFEERVVDLAATRDLPCNTGVALHSGSQSALGAGPRRQAAPPRARRRARCSTCAAARPSSASPSTCSPTRRSASSASAATPAPARACSRSPPGSRRCSSSARTSGSSCSGRSTPSAVRTSGSCPASETEKMAPWAAAVIDALESIVGPRGDRRGRSTRTCSRCCRSPTSGAAASPTASS